MDLTEFILLTQDTYESFGQKPPAARTLERLWDRETQLLATYPSSRLDEALRTLTHDDTRPRITPRDIINTLRQLTRHPGLPSGGCHIINADGTPDPQANREWQLLRDAKQEASRTGEGWLDIMDRLRHQEMLT